MLVLSGKVLSLKLWILIWPDGSWCYQTDHGHLVQAVLYSRLGGGRVRNNRRNLKSGMCYV